MTDTAASAPAAASVDPRSLRPVRIVDRIISIILLVFALGSLFVLGFFGVIMVAFSDGATSATVERALPAVGVGVLLALLLLVVGTVVSIVLMAKRRMAWIVALLTLLSVTASLLIGTLSYASLVTP